MKSLFHRISHALLGHPIARWFVILGSIVYLLSPADLLPDVIPIFGWIDDGLLVTLVATGLTDVVLERRRRLKAQKHENQPGPNNPSTVDTKATTADDRA